MTISTVRVTVVVRQIAHVYACAGGPEIAGGGSTSVEHYRSSTRMEGLPGWQVDDWSQVQRLLGWWESQSIVDLVVDSTRPFSSTPRLL